MAYKTQQDLELALVRLAERFPRRVGCKRKYIEGDDRCMLGAVLEPWVGTEILRPYNSGLPLRDVFGPNPMPLGIREILHAVFALNDTGCEWGYIPTLLGLVPGEDAGVAPVAEVLCSEV